MRKSLKEKSQRSRKNLMCQEWRADPLLALKIISFSNIFAACCAWPGSSFVSSLTIRFVSTAIMRFPLRLARLQPPYLSGSIWYLYVEITSCLSKIYTSALCFCLEHLNFDFSDSRSSCRDWICWPNNGTAIRTRSTKCINIFLIYIYLYTLYFLFLLKYKVY